jgi:hypothetical protein
VILIPAFFGLLGVIIGGIITAGANYLLDRRRELAAKERDEHHRALEVKRAARLIDIEILRVAASLKIVIDRKHWSSPKLTTEAWQKYSAVIAPVLSYSDWLTVVKAIIAIDSIEWNEVPPGTVSDELAAVFVPLFEEMMAAAGVLAPFCERTHLGQ